ncbi:protein FAR1-RELATED SEQUENCE 1-like [Camellia sinensis]|uniref:protein FAR1-RELATED SEQUENCE 1-like n=1 Tax=Camellia sinensis TaxID=4442 RepID=UPI001036D875|nr:protein FAR1-RELATED SEQUENCE 1-like [Camellia sinensis]
MNVMEIPKRYILGRWRLDAKSGEIKGGKVEVDENDPKLEILAHYRDLCPRMVKLATQASVYKPAYQLVDEGIKELCTKVNKMMVLFDDSSACGSRSNIDMSSNPNFAPVKGLKRKRKRRWIEGWG